MIVFEGKLSEQSKKAINKNLTLLKFVSMIITSVIVAIPITFLVIKDDLIWVVGYAFIPVLLIGGSLPVPKKNEHLFCPTRILIDSSRNELFVILNYNKITRHFDDVVSVKDFGEYYKIKFKFPHKSIYFLCQKDLIVQGTLEEFETLFQDKLVQNI